MKKRGWVWFAVLAVIVFGAGFWAGWPTLANPQAPQPSATATLPSEVGLVVVRVYYRSAAELQILAARFDPWEVQPEPGYAIFALPPEEAARLEADGIRIEAHPANLAPAEQLPEQAQGIPGFACYRTVAETYARAAGLASTYPGLAAWLDIGDSWKKTSGLGGSDLLVLRLTNQALPGPKPVFFILSAIHARELATAELSLRFAEYLLANYQVHPDVTWLLDHTDIQFLLQANPDGRQVVEADLGTYWRKNTNSDLCSDPWNWGIDLNRNFSFQWSAAEFGSSPFPCDETYRGPTAASEPETRAVQAYLRSLFPDRREDSLAAPAPLETSGLFLDIHSYSRLVIWPWGFTDEPAPNGPQLQTLGRKLAFFNAYTPHQAAQLYLTDGSTDDFVYGELGVAALTFEIGSNFYESCASFENQVLPENMDALLYAAKAAHRPYRLPAGPEVIDLQLSPANISIGEPVTITAVLDDSRYQQSYGAEPVQAVAGAQVYLGQPPGLPGSQLLGAMQPLDGSFDSSQEAVQFVWQTHNMAPGRYLLFVQGEDALGNVGVPSAAFIQVSGVQAAFSSSSPTVLGATTVFTDTSQGEVLARMWDFGDGQLTSTAAARVEHLYQQPGSFTVTLTVTGTNNTSQRQQPVYILQPWMNLLPILNNQPAGATNPAP